MVKILLVATGEIKIVETSEAFKLLRQGVELKLIEDVDVLTVDLKKALEEAIPTLDEIDGVYPLNEIDDISTLNEIDDIPSLDEIDGMPTLDEIDDVPILEDLLADE